jgi:hypothetical protein
LSTIPDFTRYVPPGVYVDDSGIPPVAPIGVDPTVVCLIGKGIGYHIYTETVNFAATSSVALTQQGINPTSIVVTGHVTDPSAPGQTLPYTFAADVVGTPADYSTTVDATNGLDQSVVTLVRTSTGKIEQDNPQVTVTYHYTDSDYHALHAFDDYDTLTETYGQALDPNTGVIISPLSMAANVAMQNGANQIYCIALSGIGSTDQQFNDAYRLLSGNYEANVLVPLWAGVNTVDSVGGFLQEIKALVENDATDGFLRVAICGFDQGYNPTPSDLATMAATVSSRRVIIPWPNQINLYNGVINASQTVDGFYLAAAYAGMLAARPSQMPLTRKYPIGFLGMPTAVKQALTKSVKNQLSAGGLCVTEVDRNGRLVIRHGLTTDYEGGVMRREISLVRAQDTLYKLIQEALDSAELIGTPIEQGTGLRVKSVASGGLEYAKSLGIIVDYVNLKVRQQSPPSGDPTVIEVKFAYKPAWPLNYILVSFTIDTSTGDSTLTNQGDNASTTPVSDASSSSSASTTSG